MRDAAQALGVDPYTWLLAGGDDHALAATFPPRTWRCPRLAAWSAACTRAPG